MAEPHLQTIGTKIIATLGPACDSETGIERLISEGVSVFRLNFSHGSLDRHEQALNRVRAVSERLGRPVAVLGDLAGPKIRLGDIARPEDQTEGEPPAGRGTDEEAGSMAVEPGDCLAIQREETVGRNRRVSTNYERFVDDVRIGDRVLIEDGRLRFLAEDKTEDEVYCRCLVGGELRSQKGVNLPDTPLNLDPLTEHDRRCARWARERGLAWVALSFVRRAADLHTLRELIGDDGPAVVAKIEKPEAVNRIEPIIDTADAVMVARGDLGVEMEVARVPLIQKDLIRRCNLAGRPVIVATQMLQSMIDHPHPTRAEVSDVANAIFDGADAVMLSGETAVGHYPDPAVRSMAHVARETEEYLLSLRPPAERKMPRLHMREQDAALARGAWQMAHHMDVTLMVIWSQSGNMARIFSKLRPGVPMVALSSDLSAVRRMSLYFGIHPHRTEVPQSIIDLTPQIERVLLENNWVRQGELIVVVGGTKLGEPGRSNAIVLHRIGGY